MARVAGWIGLPLPSSARAPAPYEIRDAFCAAAGEKIMELIARNIRPRDIVTRKSLENAATVVAASGGSASGATAPPARPPHPHARGDRAARGGGAGRLDQRGAAPARHRAGGRDGGQVKRRVG